MNDVTQPIELRVAMRERLFAKNPTTAIMDSVAQERAKEKARENLIRAMDVMQPHFIEMAEAFIKIQPLHYDSALIWWMWNFEKKCYEIIDDIDILNIVEKNNEILKNQNLPVMKKDNILTALKMAARKNKPKDMPAHWVQFRDVILDTKTRERFPPSHEYFCVNPIPWKLGTSTDTPTMDRLFVEWVGEQNAPMLREILAYSLLRDYPIHRSFCFIGTGRNGKTQFQQIVRKMVGVENVCSSDLGDLENNRFAAFNLYRKLVCQMGETNFTNFEKSSIFKKLTGGDVISFEMKNKNAINDVNYAKIIISTNGLPSSGDTSEGFYRRWLIIDFPNTFPEGKDIIATIPDVEFENLALKTTELLPLLLERGKFTNEGTIEERRKKYLDASNPVAQFIEEKYDRDSNSRVKYVQMFDEYKRWLSAHKKRIVKSKEFKESLIQEGFDTDKQQPSPGEFATIVVIGVRVKPVQQVISAVPRSETLDDGKNTSLCSQGVEGVPDKIVGVQELLSFISDRPGSGVSRNEILPYVALPNPEAWLDTALSSLSSVGDIFSDKPDNWRVLR